MPNKLSKVKENLQKAISENKALNKQLAELKEQVENERKEAGKDALAGGDASKIGAKLADTHNQIEVVKAAIGESAEQIASLEKELWQYEKEQAVLVYAEYSEQNTKDIDKVINLLAKSLTLIQQASARAEWQTEAKKVYGKDIGKLSASTSLIGFYATRFILF